MRPAEREGWSDALEDIARSVSLIVAARDGRLAGVTVTAPAEVAGTAFERQLEQHLSTVGLDFVDVHTVESPGPVRLVSTEFEPW